MQKIYPNFFRRFTGLSLLGVMIAIATTCDVSADARLGVFTPACADYDLRAFSFLEEHGENASASPAWLANAGLAYIKARIYCLSREEGKGVALYKRIIDGDASLPEQDVTK